MKNCWLLLVVFCLNVFGAGHGLAKEPLDPPMTFKLVRSHEINCDTYCPSWIAAEGRIVPGSAGKLAKLLKNPDFRSLPVILSSGGGDIDSALAMGRMLRKYKMAVGIGRTITDKANKKQKWHSGFVDVNRSYCFSACPLVLLGGNPRVVESASSIGLHQPTQTEQPYVDSYLEKYRIINGKKKVISRKFIKRTYKKVKTIAGFSKRLRKQLSAYLSEMNASPDILTEMEKAKPKDINIIRGDYVLVQLGFETAGGKTLKNLVGAKLCGADVKPGNCVIK